VIDARSPLVIGSGRCCPNEDENIGGSSLRRPQKRYPKGDHQISDRRLLRYLKRILRRLGLEGHLHTFRHTFISELISNGVPEAVVRSIVGHVDDRVIRLYTHIADKRAQDAIKTLNSSSDGPVTPDGPAVDQPIEGDESDDDAKIDDGD
jgi:hypothetical protein